MRIRFFSRELIRENKGSWVHREKIGKVFVLLKSIIQVATKKNPAPKEEGTGRLGKHTMRKLMQQR